MDLSNIRVRDKDFEIDQLKEEISVLRKEVENLKNDHNWLEMLKRQVEEFELKLRSSYDPIR